MSFNVAGKQSATLDEWGGLVTISNPTDLSEGSSPRCFNNDYVVGSTFTRNGLQSVYTYSSTLGPVGGDSAIDVDQGGAPWANPSNILTNSSYASVALGTSTTATAGPSNAVGLAWTNPTNVTGSSGYATVSLTVQNGAQAVLPAPTPPFISVPTPLTTANSSKVLQANQFGYAIPTQSIIQGITIDFVAFATGTATAQLTVQLVSNGLVVGTAMPQALTSTPTNYKLGSGTILWNANWNPANLNGDQLAVNIIASVNGSVGQSATVSINNMLAKVQYIGPFSSDGLQVAAFPLTGTSGHGVTGITLTLTGYQTGLGTVSVQLLKNSIPVGLPIVGTLPQGVGSITLGGDTTTWDSTWLYSDVADLGFLITASGTGTQYLSYATATVDQTAGLDNYNYVKTYEIANGTISTLVLDSAGEWWIENVNTNPGVLTSLGETVIPGSYAKSTTQFQHEYICISDLQQGTDVPRQFTLTTNNRISQVGPGLSPSVTNITGGSPIAASPTGLTQGTPFVFPTTLYYQQATFAHLTTNLLYFQWSNDVGLPSWMVVGANLVLTGCPDINGFNLNNGAGTNPAFYTISTVSPVGSGEFGPGIGFAVNQSGNTLESIPSGGNGSTAPAGGFGQVQPTLATLTTTTPIPNLEVGGQVSISGSGQSAYDATFTVLNTLNAAQLNITSTSLTGGVATYSYTLVTGVTPTVGQQVTVTGTTNGNGIFNVTNAAITAATPSSFSIGLVSGDIAPQSEVNASGIISGTIFQFDPLKIIPNTGGGTASLSGNITSGTRQCVAMFLTEDGDLTMTSLYPTVFTTSPTATAISVVNVPVGPPNVIARWIAFTEAGQGGIPGSNFYVITTPVTVNGAVYGPTVINDNLTTSATFNFTDTVLLNSYEVDLPGQDQLALIELGSSAWNISYAGRMFYGLEQNKIQNLNNTTFDGGYIPPNGIAQTGGSPPHPIAPTTTVTPAGWTIDNSVTYNGMLIDSPVFGFAFYTQNTTGSTLLTLSRLTQGAYADAFGAPIVNTSTTYSVRMTASCPSGINSGGSIVVDLFSPSAGIVYGAYELPLNQLSTAMSINTGTLLTTAFAIVPADLQLRQYGANILAGSDYAIDRFEVFPTLTPVLGDDLRVSYASAPCAFDDVTGNLGLDDENNQNCYGAAIMFDTLYLLKESSWFSTQDSPSVEPFEWGVHEVSNKIGTCGIHAYDYGEEWIVTACRQGVYVFTGGQPEPIAKEIYQVWEAINWEAGHAIVLQNDLVNQRINIHVPMATPNFWLPNAPYNPNPTSPNVMLVCSYLGTESAQDLQMGAQQHVTMFGTLASLDMRRKWTIWQIESPYSDFIKQADNLTETLYICNGTGTGKIYELNPAQVSDDGEPINFLYTTYPFVNADKAKEYPLLGFERKLYTGLQVLANGSGDLNVRLIPNSLNPNAPWTVNAFTVPSPLVLSANPTDDYPRPLNVAGQRVFVEYSTNEVGASANLSKMILYGNSHPWLKVLPNNSI